MGPRVGAGTYLLAMSSAVNAWCVAMMGLYYYAVEPDRITRTWLQYSVAGLAALVGYLFFYLTRRRLQDLNCPASWANVFAFPVPGILFLPFLCFLSSPRYANDFGASPEASGFWKVTAAILSSLIALLLLPVVVKLYAPLHLADTM